MVEVVATSDGFYNGRERSEGDRFNVSEGCFDPEWMRTVVEDRPDFAGPTLNEKEQTV